MPQAIEKKDHLDTYVRQQFAEHFGTECALVACAPGRVNLIGEHTDYNDGFVLPMALDRDVYVAARRRTDGRLRLFSADYQKMHECPLGELKPAHAANWSDYVAAVHWTLMQEGYHVSGADMLILGNLPQGCGLSSSAALELAVARAACSLGGWDWDASAMALLCQKAENAYVGVNCGIMDQFAVAVAEPFSALFLDCRSLKTTSVPVKFKDADFVVVNSAVKRSLQASKYNERRAECEAAAKILGVSSLRDASFKALQKAGAESDIWFRRARHVISENERVQGAVDALKKSDAAAFGKLMNESHESLRHDYEVSCKELDILVDEARDCEGVYGARLTGAGFGGCTVNLVKRSSVDSFKQRLSENYRQATGLSAQVFSFRPGQAARICYP